MRFCSRNLCLFSLIFSLIFIDMLIDYSVFFISLAFAALSFHIGLRRIFIIETFRVLYLILGCEDGLLFSFIIEYRAFGYYLPTLNFISGFVGLTLIAMLEIVIFRKLFYNRLSNRLVACWRTGEHEN